MNDLEAFPRLGNGSTPLLIVGAIGTDGKSTNYSNWNPDYVHLFAQGDCVCGSPGQINGTSQAVPFVTSAAAILASSNPAWNPRYTMWRLLATADHPGVLAGKAFAGIVNLSRALDPMILVEEKAAEEPQQSIGLHRSATTLTGRKPFKFKVSINRVWKPSVLIHRSPGLYQIRRAFQPCRFFT